jgi:hypothetical protein
MVPGCREITRGNLTVLSGGCRIRERPELWREELHGEWYCYGILRHARWNGWRQGSSRFEFSRVLDDYDEHRVGWNVVRVDFSETIVRLRWSADPDTGGERDISVVIAPGSTRPA